MDTVLFTQAKDRVSHSLEEKQGIGTLREKTLHAVLKHYYAPDTALHEIPIGNYIADIYTGTEIIEIQNGNFYKIRKKLKSFLAHYSVTLVYPMPHIKWLIWMDEETGELSKRRKSPVTGNVYKAFGELYRIKEFLNEENLHFRFPLVDIEEYRLLNGWSRDRKKGSCRYDRIPVALFDEVVIEDRKDYLSFLPDGLTEEFTSADLAKTAGISRKAAGLTLHILAYVGVVVKTGKRGRSYTYNKRKDLIYEASDRF
ncbi:MAG: hypothetical protein IKM28_00295 [Lachnospiraceae bacterium]|nr:hypothetical protein [Lachnospiraceae bacterium]